MAKTLLKTLKSNALNIGLIVAIALGYKGCNMAMNNRSIETHGYQTESYATGWMGHVEFTQYSDGSKDVKVYPDLLGHRYLNSKLYQDLNGDRLVDRIRESGPEWKANRLSVLLTRETDYKANQEKFDKADQMLQELMAKYPATK